MTRLKTTLKVLRSYFPRSLPTGMTSFNDWVSDIIFISGLPDNPSTRKLCAGFILSVPGNIGYMSIRKISGFLVKAAANQVAAQILQPTAPKAPELTVVPTLETTTSALVPETKG